MNLQGHAVPDQKALIGDIIVTYCILDLRLFYNRSSFIVRRYGMMGALHFTSLSPTLGPYLQETLFLIFKKSE